VQEIVDGIGESVRLSGNQKRFWRDPVKRIGAVFPYRPYVGVLEARLSLMMIAEAEISRVCEMSSFECFR
jgi:hypothetical protein